MEFAAPTTWNSLPDSVKDADSIDAFKSRLKTDLFGLSYGQTKFFNCVVNASLFYELQCNNNNNNTFTQKDTHTHSDTANERGDDYRQNLQSRFA